MSQPVCPTPEKRAHRSKAAAKRYQRRRYPPPGQHKDRLYPYPCPSGTHWHLTHQTPAQQQTIATRIARKANRMTDIQGWRINQIRNLCASNIDHDAGKSGNGLTDRAWLAQSVLNILDGNIDHHRGDTEPTAPTAVDELCDAIRLTVEYVGTDTLHPGEGWSWFDALRKYRPDIAAQFVEWHNRVVVPTGRALPVSAIGGPIHTPSESCPKPETPQVDDSFTCPVCVVAQVIVSIEGWDCPGCGSSDKTSQ